MGPCPTLLALVNSSWPHSAAGCCAKTPALAPRSLGTARAQQLPPSRASVSPSLPAGRARGEPLAVSPLLSLPLTRAPSPGSTAGSEPTPSGRMRAHHALWPATTPIPPGSDPGKVPGPDPILRQPPPRGGSNASPSSWCHPARGRAALRGNQILKSAHLELAGLSPSRTPAAPAALQSEAEALTGRDSGAGQRLLTCHLPPSGAAVARGGACGGDTLSPRPGPALGGAGASRSPSGEILGQNPGGEEPAPKWAAAGCAGSPGAGTNGVSGAVGAPGPAFRQGCAASCPRHF